MKSTAGGYGSTDGFARAQAAYDAEEPPYYSVEDLDGEDGEDGEDDGEEGDSSTAVDA